MDDLSRAALDVPLARALGCRLFDDSAPATGAWCEVGDLATNGAGGVHASALDVLVELAGFLAVAPGLGTGEHAVTHASSRQLVRAAEVGDRVEARGEVLRRTRRLVFVEVVATSAGREVVRAQLTKSVVAHR